VRRVRIRSLFPLVTADRFGHDEQEMMKRKRLLLIGALAAVMAGVFLCWPRGPKEPVYEGRKLTAWINDAGSSTNAAIRDRGQEAIKAIGTNALPFLLKRFSEPVSSRFDPFSAWAHDHHFPFLEIDVGAYRFRRTISGLYMLGPDIAPALPALSEFFDDPQRGQYLPYLFAYCGDASIPHARAAMNSTNRTTAGHGMLAISMMMRKTGAVTHLVLEGMQSPHVEVRREAAKALGDASSQPEEVVTALVNGLKDPDPLIVQNSSNSLAHLSRSTGWQIAQEARMAVIKLQRAALPPPAR
jgi:hypothetical protein